LGSGDDFFDVQSEASGVKARIISKHFDTWSNIVLKEAIRLGQKIAYIDLYCGPGRYGDGNKSTPLLVLERAIAKPVLAQNLVTIFNDEDAEAIKKLQTEVDSLPGVNSLALKPVLMNSTVGPETEQYFRATSTVPSFTFIDPFGYVGLTRDLIEGVTKNWGCDCIFFFSYSSINRALSASIFTSRMEAIFGPERAAALEAQMQSIKGSHGSNPAVREEIIVDALTAALEELNRGQSYVRTFRFKKGKRTSHMLVFVTKSPKGYRVMNEIMAKEGYKGAKGMPFYTYYDDPPSPTKLFYEEFDKLKEELCDQYAGKTNTMLKIYEEHSLRRNYIASNYKDALNELEAENLITADPPADKRPMRSGKRTFADGTKVTFPPRNK